MAAICKLANCCEKAPFTTGSQMQIRFQKSILEEVVNRPRQKTARLQFVSSEELTTGNQHPDASN